MSGNFEKRKQLDDEMSRFEAEILGTAQYSSDESDLSHFISKDATGPLTGTSSKTSGVPPLPPPPKPPNFGSLAPPPPPPSTLMAPNVPRFSSPLSGPGSPFRSNAPHLGDQDRRGPQGIVDWRGGPPGPACGPPRTSGQSLASPHAPIEPQLPQNGHIEAGPGFGLSHGPIGPIRPSSNGSISGPPAPFSGPRLGPAFVPHQLMRPHGVRVPPPPPGFLRPPMGMGGPNVPPPPPVNSMPPSVIAAAPILSGPQIVYSSQPTRYTNIIKPTSEAASVNPVVANTSLLKNKEPPSLGVKESKKAKKLKTCHATACIPPSCLVDQVKTTVSIEKKNKSGVADSSSVAASSLEGAQQTLSSRSKKERKPKKNLRYAGGSVWEDTSLSDWPTDDFRMFAGDLGNDVTDELLTRTFSMYPSFVRAKVIRDKHTNKSRGYGFLSFREPSDYTRAMREMNGRYVGSRPIKLRKSSWKDRGLDAVLKKEKEKKLQGLK